jgi:lipid-binding SYLF domain-containing protein
MNSNAERDNEVNMVDKTRYMNMPYSSTLGSEIRKATYSLMNMFTAEWLRDKSIPGRLLKNCAGIAFMTVVKAGFLFAGKVGTGLVIGKLPDGSWSAPSAIGTAGMAWGLLAGAELTDFVMILNNEAALRAFSGVGNVQLGAGIDLALGPIGRGAAGNVSVGDKGATAVLSYAHSKGLFGGITLDGAVIATRRSVNFNFYGKHIDPMDILTGRGVAAPKAGAPLYDAINKCISSLPEAAAAADAAAGAGAGAGAGATAGAPHEAAAAAGKAPAASQKQSGTAWGESAAPPPFAPEETLSI